MKITDAAVGQRVAYKPAMSKITDYGVIKELRGANAMVLYDGDTIPQSTSIADLQLLREAPPTSPPGLTEPDLDPDPEPVPTPTALTEQQIASLTMESHATAVRADAIYDKLTELGWNAPGAATFVESLARGGYFNGVNWQV